MSKIPQSNITQHTTKSSIDLLGFFVLNPQESEAGDPDILPEAERGIDAGLVGVNDWLIPDEIGFLGLDELGSLDQLPAAEEQDANEDHRVVGEERADGPPAWDKDRVSLNEHDDGHEDHADDVDIWLEPAYVIFRLALFSHFARTREWVMEHEHTSIRQGPSINALGLQSAVEEDVGGAHDNIVEELGGGDQIDKPADRLGGTVTNLEEAQEGEHHGDSEAPVRDTVFGGCAEELGGVAFKCKTVQGSGRHEAVCVAGRENASH